MKAGPCRFRRRLPRGEKVIRKLSVEIQQAPGRRLHPRQPFPAPGRLQQFAGQKNRGLAGIVVQEG
jgi:hypothetical protein